MVAEEEEGVGVAEVVAEVGTQRRNIVRNFFHGFFFFNKEKKFISPYDMSYKFKVTRKYLVKDLACTSNCNLVRRQMKKVFISSIHKIGMLSVHQKLPPG